MFYPSAYGLKHNGADLDQDVRGSSAVMDDASCISFFAVYYRLSALWEGSVARQAPAPFCQQLHSGSEGGLWKEGEITLSERETEFAEVREGTNAVLFLSIWVSSLSALVIFTSSTAEPVRWVTVRDTFSPSCEDPVKVMPRHWGAGWLVAALSTASCFISACS